MFQQWCGINVIFNYAGEIFKQAGYNINDTLTNIVMTGLVNFLFTFVALFTVDRLGRKPLMLFGAAGLTLIYTAIGYCYHLKGGGSAVPNTLFLVLVLAAIGCYAMSLAPVIWVIISEIFPNRIRGTAMSIAVGFLWIACFLLTYTFPIFNAVLGASVTFWIYAGICGVGFAWSCCACPRPRARRSNRSRRSWWTNGEAGVSSLASNVCRRAFEATLFRSFVALLRSDFSRHPSLVTRHIPIMTSRERILTTCAHREPDKLAVDFGAGFQTGIHVSMVYKLRQALGLDRPGTPVKVVEVYQMLGEIAPDLQEALGVDAVSLHGTGTMFGFPQTEFKEWQLADGTPVLVPEGLQHPIRAQRRSPPMARQRPLRAAQWPHAGWRISSSTPSCGRRRWTRRS